MKTRDVEALRESNDVNRDVEELRASRRRLVLAADEDRRSIERELHDGVHQHLTALAVNLQLASGLAEVDPAGAKALLEQMRRDVQLALDEVAQLGLRIHSPLIEAGGLAAALRAAASSARAPLAVDVDAAATYPPEVVSTVYRCCLVVLGFPGARVTVSDADGTLTFVVAAEGVPATAFDRLRDRVEAVGGDLTVEATPDGATRARGSLPLS